MYLTKTIIGIIQVDFFKNRRTLIYADLADLPAAGRFKTDFILPLARG